MSWQAVLTWLCICLICYAVGVCMGSRERRRNGFHRYSTPPDPRNVRAQWDRIWRTR